jgi:predicted TIM-barrel fold metal-dependent hydrolase
VEHDAHPPAPHALRSRGHRAARAPFSQRASHHGAPTGCGYRGILEAKGIDNLVVDTSGGYPEAGILDYALEHLGADHVVYGSDLPIRETSVTLNRILGTRMSDTAREKILHDNAARLLKLAA